VIRWDAYVTPLFKSLLRQRNRLRRKGRIEDAEKIALKINSIITHNQATRLEKLSTATSKQLWDAVTKSRNCNANNGSLLLMRDPDTINDFFANIAAKEHYDRNELGRFRCDNIDAVYQPLTSVDVESYHHHHHHHHHHFIRSVAVADNRTIQKKTRKLNKTHQARKSSYSGLTTYNCKLPCKLPILLS